MRGLFDFLQPADPNSEERQWSDVPIGLRLGVLGNQLMALSQGRAPDMGGLALLERAGAQTLEERKAAKRKKMLQTYYAKHPNPQIRSMAESGMLDEDMMAAVLKDELGFERFKQEKTYEQDLAKQKMAQTLQTLGISPPGAAGGAGGGAGSASPPTMPSGSAELSGGGASTGYQPQGADELNLALAMAAEGKGPGEIAQALADLRMKKQQEARMAQTEERQQGAEIDRRGSEISKDFQKALEPITTTLKAADFVESLPRNEKTGLPEASGAQQIQVLYSFVKALDPDSVVREAEVALTGEAASKIDRFKFWQEKVVQGGVLPPEAVADISNAIAVMGNVAKEAAQRKRVQAFDMGARRGISDMGAFIPGTSADIPAGGMGPVRPKQYTTNRGTFEETYGD